jgi:hypothetical protein
VQRKVKHGSSAFLICLGVTGCARPAAQRLVAEIQPLWSVSLNDNPSLGETSSSFEATRRAVIAGDRIVVVFQTGPMVYVENRPKGTYRLLSLDLKSGKIMNQQVISDYRNPDLYATDDDHIIMGEFSLTRLNPDLTPTSEQFTEKGQGRTIQISPDGTTLAHETTPGTELLDSHSFLPTGKRLAESTPTAVSRSAVVTDNVHWIGQYPHDSTFVTLSDKSGQHLLYHGQCSGRPTFLDNTKVLVTGCGKLTILDASGRTLQERNLSSKTADFAGVSRDGSRFALQNYETTWGDPPRISSESFTIYDTEKAEPIAIIQSRPLPERRSWSAFSKDGHLFVMGSSSKLSLFRIP